MATPTPQPTPRRRFPDLSAWLPGRRGWLWFVPAFALGLVLFFVAIRQSREDGFFRAGTVPPTAADEAYAPLPAPLPAGEGSGIEPLPPPPVEEAPVVQAPPPPPPPVERRVEPERPEPVPATRDRDPTPIAGRTPPPDYPARSLVRGEGGTTLVVVHIGPDGVPTSVQVAQSSGSRDLDRAATTAVRRWRFEPAVKNGQPTVGTVMVPIDFRP